MAVRFTAASHRREERSALRRDRRTPNGSQPRQRTDALAMLVRAADDEGRQMTDAELRDQLMTLLLAATTPPPTRCRGRWNGSPGTRRSWRAVAAAEASAAGDPAGDEYLDAVAKETLRIRPVVSTSAGCSRNRWRSPATGYPPASR